MTHALNLRQQATVDLLKRYATVFKDRQAKSDRVFPESDAVARQRELAGAVMAMTGYSGRVQFRT